jgi:hypothetical protein
MAHFKPPLDFPRLLETGIRDIIKSNIKGLNYFSFGEHRGAIPTERYPLTTIMIEGDQKIHTATELDRYIYTGYIAIDGREPDNVGDISFKGDTHEVKSYTHGRWYIREVQSLLTLTELQKIKFDERNEGIIQVDWGAKIYGAIDRDNGLHNRAQLPFTITTQATSTDC